MSTGILSHFMCDLIWHTQFISH